MKENVEGVVIEVNAEMAKVKLSRHSDCSHCGMCQGADAVILEAPNTYNTKPGQRVILETKESNMFKAALIVFLLPLIAVVGGIYSGYLLSSILKVLYVVPIILCVGLFGTAALLAIKRLDTFLQLSGDMPKIVAVID
jgi:sigma-E factor negative regulatory protein RseC